MKSFTRLLLVFAAMTLAFGCAQKSATPLEEKESAMITSPRTLKTVAEVEQQAASPAGKHIVSKAKTAIGTPYVYGGTTPGGFDCSGLVKWSYSHVGVTLPRTAREQSVVGEKIHNVEDMRAGDIVAFRHPKRGYHTGIYVGDGKFIHSPRKKTRVRINSLSDPYFRETLLGARRVNMEAGENLVAQAQARLDAMIAEKTKLSVSDKNMRAMRENGKSVQTATKTVKRSRSVASAKKGQTVSSSKKSGKTQAKAKKGSASSKKSDKTVAINKKSSKNQKATVAKNSRTANQSKNSGKQVATAKKSGHSAVSMLNKKAQPKHTAKRNHS